MRGDGTDCIGRKASQLMDVGAWKLGTGGFIGKGSEGVPLKGHQEESATITFHFLSLKEPFGKVC